MKRGRRHTQDDLPDHDIRRAKQVLGYALVRGLGLVTPSDLGDLVHREKTTTRCYVETIGDSDTQRLDAIERMLLLVTTRIVETTSLLDQLCPAMTTADKDRNIQGLTFLHANMLADLQSSKCNPPTHDCVQHIYNNFQAFERQDALIRTQMISTCQAPQAATVLPDLSVQLDYRLVETSQCDG